MIIISNDKSKSVKNENKLNITFIFHVENCRISLTKRIAMKIISQIL